MLFISNLLIKFLGKEVRGMMAMLFALAIVEGRKTFSQVPRLLKEKTKQELITMGCEELAVEG